jgi:hypothetical protein
MRRLHIQCGYSRQRDDSYFRENGTRFHNAAQNDTQFKTYELFISGNFNLIFSDCS